MGVFIYLGEVDKHYEIAKAAGAEIVHPPKDVAYGGERSLGTSVVLHDTAKGWVSGQRALTTVVIP